MRSNSLDSKLRAKEVELKRHEQEIADQDEVCGTVYIMIKNIRFDIDIVQGGQSFCVRSIVQV